MKAACLDFARTLGEQDVPVLHTRGSNVSFTAYDLGIDMPSTVLTGFPNEHCYHMLQCGGASRLSYNFSLNVFCRELSCSLLLSFS